MGYIYKIINKVNGKYYIGQTCRSIEARWKEHQSNSQNNGFLGYNWPLYKALRKYGISNFKIEQIEQCKDTLLNEKEKNWIKYYDSFNNGYNSTLGGEGNLKYDINNILELWNQGYCCSEIERKLGIKHTSLVSERLQGIGISKKDIVERGHTKTNIKVRKPVLQFDLNGNFLRRFESSIDVQKQLGFDASNIRAACRGKLQTAYGYKWNFEKAGG